LPEAIKLTVARWEHVQELDYEQLPFKCRHRHGRGHFAKHCKKKAEEQVDKINEEQWTVVQKTSHQKKGNGKWHTSGAPGSSKINQEKDATPNNSEKTQINPAGMI